MGENYASRMSDLVLRLYHLCQERQVEFASRYDLTVAEFRCLRILSRAEELSVGQLAERMNLSSARLTRLVEDLRRKGLVERREPEGDRRLKLISLTAKGRELAGRMNREYDEMHRQILDGVKEPPLPMVIESFERLIEAMERWAETHATQSRKAKIPARG